MSQPQQLSQHTAKIRELNDALRTTRDPIAWLMMNGSLVITRSLDNKGNDFIDHAVSVMRSFSDFNEDNDPWGEHDCALMEVDGETVIWKFDYYSPDMLVGSEAPWDASVTRRVLTLMLAQDY